MDYTELHLHTYYSLLDGLNSPAEYLQRGKELGMSHMAITDHGTLSGHREFQKHAKEAGITPILGCEMYISPTDRFDRRSVAKRDDNTQAYNHLIVLAQNAKGLENLNALSQIAWTEGFYSKPRIDLDVLEEYNDGLIVLTGCLNGLIAKAIANDQPAQANMLTGEFKRIFGERVFMEIQGHNPPEINSGLLHYAREHGIRPVVTSDCHYAREEDLWLEEAMLILSTKPKENKKATYAQSMKYDDFVERFNYLYPIIEMDDEGKPVLDEETGEPIKTKRMTFQEYQIFLRAAHQQEVLLKKQGIGDEAITNSMIVANMIEPYPYYEGEDLLPRPKNGHPDDILEKMVREGMEIRGHTGDADREARIREELDIIKDKDFSTYFLIEADVINWCKEQEIVVGPGRGSGAGSLVNYYLGITGIDPIPYNLLFFRFINPERNDYPDIDTDIEDRRRSDVKAYLQRKFKHVASIANFNTFAGKSSVRDAARVFKVPLDDVNKALKGADYPPKMDFFAEWGKTDNFKQFKSKYPDALKLAMFLHGRVRSQGMHAGGIVVAKEPISKYAPMQTAKDESDEAGNRIPLVALTMEDVESVGLIKYDFLGLKALTILSDTVKMVKQRHGVDIDLYDIPLDDKKVYESLSNGFTQGVFQAEGHTFTQWLLAAGAQEFNDLVVGTSIARPGPLHTVGESYKRRQRGEEPIAYSHEVMRKHTEETLGLIVYQEQVMLAMTDLAGMDMSTADRVRRIISKKKDKSLMEQYKGEFIEGAAKNVRLEVAERLWEDFEEHSGYSFNKSHAVVYSMITYWTAWLKQNYTIEFMTAMLKNEKDKDKRLDYLMEAKRLGLRIMLPHVNDSGIDFEIQRDEKGEFIRFGLSDIKYISGKVGNRLLEQRPFTDYNHLFETVMAKGSGLNSRVLQALNAIGGAVFDDHPKTGNERENLYEYLAIPAFQTADLPPRVKAQFRRLEDFSGKESFVSAGMVKAIKNGDGWVRLDIVDDTGNAGVFIDGGHGIEAGKMYVFLIANNSVMRYISIEDLQNGLGGDFRSFLGATGFPDVPDGMMRVVSFKTRLTKKGARMATIVLSDEHKNLTSALVWPSLWAKCHTRCKEGSVVDIQLAETDDGALFVQNVL